MTKEAWAVISRGRGNSFELSGEAPESDGDEGGAADDSLRGTQGQWVGKPLRYGGGLGPSYPVRRVGDAPQRRLSAARSAARVTLAPRCGCAEVGVRRCLFASLLACSSRAPSGAGRGASLDRTCSRPTDERGAGTWSRGGGDAKKGDS